MTKSVLLIPGREPSIHLVLDEERIGITRNTSLKRSDPVVERLGLL